MSSLTDRIAREQMHVILDRWGTSPSGRRTMTPRRAFEIARQAAEATEAEIAALLPTALASAVRGVALGLQYGFSLEEVASRWEDSDGLDTLNRIAKGEYT